jgi:malonyl CoA-acyl carrier protein transacylase
MIRSAEGLREELTDHLVHGVQWVATIRNMAAIGVTDFVEVGPGRVLTGLIKRISPDVQAHALDETDDGWLPEAPAKSATAAKPTKRRASRAKDPKEEA